MGLIRKTLMISTVGVVRGSSKKQRVAKAQLKELHHQTKIIRATSSVTPAPIAPSAGWYPAPGQPGRLQYFDGSRWTDSYAAVQPYWQ